MSPTVTIHFPGQKRKKKKYLRTKTDKTKYTNNSMERHRTKIQKRSSPRSDAGSIAEKKGSSLVVVVERGEPLTMAAATGDIKVGTTEIRDLTRIERIGAHSHIRGKF